LLLRIVRNKEISPATSGTDLRWSEKQPDPLLRPPFEHLIYLRVERLDGCGICLGDRQSLLRILTLREGRTRLARDRDRTIEELNLRLREMTGLLRKEQATRESLTRRLTSPAPQILARRQPLPERAKATTPPRKNRKKMLRRAGPPKIRTRGTPKRYRRNHK
jgi:hypothetical protein